MADLKFTDYSGIVGNPVNPFQQSYNDTCAIKSQQIILNEFGINVTEDQLVQYSAERGWYSGNGTNMSDVGRILADAGIPCTQRHNATKFDLMDELAHGHKVIVAVDSGELWEGGIGSWFKDIFAGDTPDHALIVAGIDNTDPNNPMVILTDPGTGQPAQPYPLDQFMDAWEDSRNYMVSTDIPTPAAMEAFTANGQTDMHLPEIAGVDYPTFQDFMSYSHLIEPALMPDLTMAFQTYPTMPAPDFNTAINNFGLPAYNLSLFTPDETFFNPMEFDYAALSDTSWIMNPMMDVNSTIPSTADIMNHSVDTLTDLHQDALDQVQFCMDHGMYSSAQYWQAHADDIQSDINNITEI